MPITLGPAFLVLAAIAGLALAGGAQGAASYVVRPGDTLAALAERFYGDRDEWPRLYEANRERIGPDSSALEVGTPLTIPDRSASAAAPAAGQPAVLSPALSRGQLEVRLVARPDFGMLIDPGRPDGGALPAIVDAAFRRAGYLPKLEISSQPFEEGSTPSVTFPYPRDPAFEASFIYSAPIGSLTMLPYFRRGATVVVRDFADLGGRSVCAPEPVLAELRKVAGSVPSLRPIAATSRACLLGLIDRAVDVALVSPLGGQALIDSLAAGEAIESHGAELDLGSLHVLIPKYSSYGTAMAYKLNDALRQMQQSGEISQMVANYAPQAGPTLAPAPAPALAPTTTPTTPTSRHTPTF
jgi:hypothetical protein